MQYASTSMMIEVGLEYYPKFPSQCRVVCRAYFMRWEGWDERHSHYCEMNRFSMNCCCSEAHVPHDNHNRLGEALKLVSHFSSFFFFL